jgi:hypothetical protein
VELVERVDRGFDFGSGHGLFWGNSRVWCRAQRKVGLQFDTLSTVLGCRVRITGSD